MDYLFYSLYSFFYVISKGEPLFRTPEQSALSIMALDSASIILSAIYLIVYREFEGYGLWCFVWFVLACVIYFILLKYYDCQKAISKISKKPLSYRLISHIISGLFTLFSIWLWIFYGLEFIYQYM